MDTDHTPIEGGMKIAAAAAAAAAVIVGGMVLLGWAFDIGVLKSILPGWVSMKANAAVGFILLGIALWLAIRPPATFNSKSAIFLARLCGLLVGLFGLLTLGEYIFGWNFGIDQFLFNEPVGTVATSAPGRMSPESALCFVLLTVALWVNSTSHKTSRSILASVNLGLLVMTIALAAMLSYAMPSLGPYGWFGLTIMALHTSLLFALLGLAVIANSWQQDVLQWSLGRKSTTAFACGMALLVFIGLNTSRSQFWLNETNSKIATSEEVLGNIVSLHTELTEAQAHTRGYIITGDDGFLTAYLADMSAYNLKMDALRPLLAGNPHRQQQLTLIETKADLLQRWSQQFIDAQRSGKGNAARSKMDAHAGDLLDNIHSAFEQIENEQQQLIDELKQEAASVTRFAYISIAAGTLSSLLIFLAVIFKLNFAVNERKQADALLRKSVDEIEDLYNNAPCGYHSLEKDGIIRQINATELAWLGYTRDEVIGKIKYPDLLTPASRLFFQEKFPLVKQQGFIHDFQYEIIRKDGTKFSCLANVTAIYDANGDYFSSRSSVFDITERKRLEAARLEAIDRFQKIVQLVPGVIFQFRLCPDGSASAPYVSDAFREIYRLDPEEIREDASKVFTRIHPDDLESFQASLQSSARDLTLWQQEFRLQFDDGTVRWLFANGLPQREADGSTVWNGFNADISEHRGLEMRLLESEEKFKAIFDNATDGISLADMDDKKLLFSNATFCRMLGYAPEEIANLHVMDIHPKNEVPYVISEFEKQARGEKVVAENIPVMRKDGSVFYAEITSAHINLDGKTYLAGFFRDISERKLAEDALKDSEEQYRTMIESSNDMIWALTADARFTFINRQAADVTGRSIEEWLGETFEPLVLEDDLPMVLELFGKVMGGEKAHYEIRVKKSDGGILTLSVNSSPIFKDGKVSGTISFASDITERKQAHEVLHTSEQRFMRFFMQSPIALVIVNKDGVITRFNDRFTETLGYTTDDVPTMKEWWQLAYPDESYRRWVLDTWNAAMAKAAKEGVDIEPIEIKVACKSGAERTMIIGGIILGDNLLATLVDITERKQAEEALRKTNVELSLFRNLLDNSSDLIAVVDPITLRYLDANEAACRNLGYSREEFLSMSVFDIDPSINPDTRKTIDEQMQKQGSARFEGIQQRKDGSTFPVEINSRLTKLDKPYVLNVVRDITERKLTEEKIHKLNEELETKVQERTGQLLAAQEELVRKEKLAVLGQVAGSVGHELRNPLGVMNNAVYYLQTVLADADSSVKEYLNIIKDEIAGSERIVSDLLDAVRTKSPQPEKVGVAKLIEQTLNKLTLPTSVTVKLDIPATLPALLVDAQQIHQVLRNLISNGAEAMAEGGTLEISALEDAQAKTIAVSVRDSGIGMTPEHLSKLFQPLFTTKARGIGLGLVVVKNLTEANGGTIKVQSEAGQGTTFTLTLPADDVGRDSSRHVANPVGLKPDLQNISGRK